ncbi:MAG TPA: glycosyltransferase family 39 protein [Solirubrobacteraceae bacterium]|nr:glycosyltransferase family 39 protein [Solirubrobacteraceae bacterium]
MDAAVDSPRSRPALLPKPGWARGALLLLIAFALLRSVLWASVQPAFFAPDEDYHWSYVNYLVWEGAIPNLNKPFSPLEMYRTQVLTGEGQYFAGPRTNYKGAPHAVLAQLGPEIGYRKPSPPKPRPVLHPPGYYLPDVLIDNILWNKVSVTRLTAMRYYSAALGALTIYLVWLLAAAVLAREWQRLAAAALVSLQTLLAFSASTMTNDVAVAVSLNATLAWCAWMLRGPPRARDGIGLGVLFSVAVMVKATMLSLVLVIAVTLALLWKTYPQSRREIWGIVKWAVAIPAVLTGWWYVRLVIVTHSILGANGSLTASHVRGPGLGHAPAIAWEWIGNVYRSYWFDYNNYEVRVEDLWFWLPVVAMAIVAAGFVRLVIRRMRTLFAPEGSELRVVFIIVLTALLLVVPPLALDVLRGTRGLPFVTQQARFLTPAYPGLAVIAVLALRELTGFARRAYPIAVGILVTATFVFYCHTWVVWTLERFYGAIHGHWLRALRHASYDKPNFVTPGFLATLIVLGVLAFVSAFVLTVWGSRRDARRGDGAPGAAGEARLPTAAASPAPG